MIMKPGPLLHALVVARDRRSLQHLIEAAGEQGMGVEVVDSLEHARRRMRRTAPDVIFVDGTVQVPGGCDWVHAVPPPAPAPHARGVVARGDRRNRVVYVTGDLGRRRLRRVLRSVSGSVVGSRFSPVPAVGPEGTTSEAMQEVLDRVRRFAACDAPVLLRGERGTGKRWAAGLIHARSARAAAPLVKLAARDLGVALEAGDVGAGRSGLPPLLQLARGGTLVALEVQDLSSTAQALLCRELEGWRNGRAPLRLCSTTAASPAQAICTGRLRADLYYCLDVLPLWIPPLRDRKEDVPALAHAFVAELNAVCGEQKSIAGAALELLQEYSWPGNVRELKDVVYSAHVLADEVIAPGDLPPAVAG